MKVHSFQRKYKNLNCVSLLASEIFLESVTPSMICPFLKTTAAETTGPASGPLPTSSTPAINS